jgi:hypothetical protein
MCLKFRLHSVGKSASPNYGLCTKGTTAFYDFLTTKPTRYPNFLKFILEMKLYMFRIVPLATVRSYSLYIQQWYMSYRFVDSFRAGSGCSILILLLLESCLQTCMTYTIAECTVNNSWRWAEELSETCRVSFPNKFEKISASGWFFCKEICHDLRSHERKKKPFMNLSIPVTV